MNLFGKFNKESVGSLPKTEYFYYTPDLPQITVQQSRDICNDIRKNYTNVRNEINISREGPKSRVTCENNYAKNILYGDNWNPNTFQAKKPLSHFYNELVNYSWNKIKTDYLESKINNEVEEFHHGINRNFFILVKNRKMSFMPLFSKSYPLNIDVELNPYGV